MADGLGVVRIKPLGAGGGGVERSATDRANIAIDFDLARNVVSVGRKTFAYPSHVIGPDSSQESLYNTYMPMRIDGFLQGLNCNIMAYGQTGTGKTHTMFGPPGLMARAAAGEFGVEVISEYGLFPRGVIELYNRLQQLQSSGTGVDYVMTVSAVELAIDGNLDMFDKSSEPTTAKVPFRDSELAGVSIDRTCFPARLYGMTQLPLKGPDDVLRTFGALASRNTSGTTMNDSSSRSHCFVFLNLYAHEGGQVRMSRFQFSDLAGSERLAEAHGGQTDFRAGNTSMWQGVATNYSLMMLSKTIRELLEAKRRGKRQDHARTICNNPLSGDLVAIVGDSLVGSALTAIVVCVSQAPTNAQQSRHALEFGETFAQLEMDRLEPRPQVSIEKISHEAQTCLATNREHLNTKSSNKYAVRRGSMARDAMSQLIILKHFGRQ